MTLTRTFFAWHRSGLAAALADAPPPGASRAAVPATVRLRGSAQAAVVPIELSGPGDVAGLDPREVRRTEPRDGSADFEPSYFPYVELLSTDLPWRFSPAGPRSEPLPDPESPGATARTRRSVLPWLALVVVASEHAAISSPAPGRLPVLTCPAGELPSPAEAWAWAHVQVATADGQDPAQALGDPSRAVARLLCARRLEEGTRYVGCLVPTFASGRMGAADGSVDPLAPAWGDGPAATLPVYFSYGFTTGADGSFETLARRLRPRPAPEGATGRTIATDAAGWGVPDVAGSSTRMQGALRPLGDSADPAAAKDEPPPDPALAAELAAAISATGTGVQLRPPIYGQDYAGGATSLASDAPGWLAELNLDPRRRLAAGLAAWAVAVDQEDLSDRAWQQLAAAGMRPTTAADPALASELSGALIERGAAAGAGLLAPPLARMVRPGGPLAQRGLPAAGKAGRPAEAGIAVAAATTSVGPFTPTFDEPAYIYLRGVAPEWLLPGNEDVPDDSIIVLRTNPAFTEAFLAGLNHALSRELEWRRYPLEPTGTLFRRFWSASPAATDSALPPLADWPAGSELGSHTPDADQLVLLVRGELLRRFPTAAVYLSRTGPDGSEVHLRPTLAATLSPGTTFLGFPLTPAQALGPPADGAGPWSIVIQEAVDHARFGCDDAPSGGAGAPLAGWQDLDWSHPHLRDATHLPVAGPLDGLSRALTAAPSPVPVPTATWGLDAGHLAAILQQPAFRIRIPLALWLSPPGAES